MWDIRNTNEPFQSVQEDRSFVSLDYHPAGTHLIGVPKESRGIQVFYADSSSVLLKESTWLLDDKAHNIRCGYYNFKGTEIVTAGSVGRIVIWPNKFVSPIDIKTLNGHKTECATNAIVTSNEKKSHQTQNKNFACIKPSNVSLPQNLVSATCSSQKEKVPKNLPSKNVKKSSGKKIQKASATCSNQKEKVPENLPSKKVKKTSGKKTQTEVVNHTTTSTPNASNVASESILSSDIEVRVTVHANLNGNCSHHSYCYKFTLF